MGAPDGEDNQMKKNLMKTKSEDTFEVAGRTFSSRLLVGTGKYKSMAESAKAIKLSGANIVTVAVRRVNISDKKRPLLKLVLNVYFLPYNLLRLARYLRIRHEYKKNEIEMEVLSQKLKEDRNWKAYGNK